MTKPHHFVLAVAALALVAGCDTGGGGDDTSPQAAAPPAAAAAGPQAAPEAAHSPSPSPTRTSLAKPGSMAALGDSITRGFDACDTPLQDCTAKSWATGTDRSVNSQAQRLGVPPDKVFNYAVTGAKMSDLPGQARAAAYQKAAYTTILMGANDACRSTPADMTPVARYEQHFRTSLNILREGMPKDGHVLVVSIPDLGRLWESGQGDAWARTVWNTAKICPAMLADPTSKSPAATTRRQQVRDRVTAYNDVLRQVCKEWDRCRYDGGVVNARQFTKGQLSKWDYFHPNGGGQAELADMTFREGFRWE